MITGFISFIDYQPKSVPYSETPFFNRITFWGYKGFTGGIPISNSSGVYLGITTGSLPIYVGAGTSNNITLDLGKGDSLQNYYCAGSSGDGLYYMGW
jgi:hypothetical protein